MRRHVQFSLSEQEFNQLKAKLAERGETWQSWGEQKTAELLSESIDSFGIPLTEMAFDRSAFQNKIAEKLVGALGEFAFIQIAQKNGQKKWIAHKQTEVENLLLQMAAFMDLPTKGKFDKKKAAIEMIEFYRDKLSGFVTRSKNAYLTYYKLKPKKLISDSDLMPLLDRATKTLD
jgi:hypothetical protein